MHIEQLVNALLPVVRAKLLEEVEEARQRLELVELFGEVLVPDEEEILEHASELARQILSIWPQAAQYSAAGPLGPDLLPLEMSDDVLERLESSFASFVVGLAELRVLIASMRPYPA